MDYYTNYCVYTLYHIIKYFYFHILSTCRFFFRGKSEKPRLLPNPFILPDHLALGISVGFKVVFSQEKSIQVTGERLADTDTHLITPNPLASSWQSQLLTVGIVESLLELQLTRRTVFVCVQICLHDSQLWFILVMHRGIDRGVN